MVGAAGGRRMRGAKGSQPLAATEILVPGPYQSCRGWGWEVEAQ